MTLRPGSQLLRVGTVLCTLLLLVGCDWFAPSATPTPPGPTPLPGTPGPSATPGAPATAAAAGGPTLPPGTPVPQGGTLTIRLDKDVTTLNPLLVARGPADVDAAAQTVTGLIFSGLTRIDNHLQPQPDLAESWSVAPDGLSVDFKLRPGVLWSDGQPVTPDDVIWSYQTYLQVPVSSTLQVHLHDAVLAIQPSPVASDTVRFWLKKKYAPLLSDVAAAILPRHLLGAIPPDQMAAAPFSANPVGSGPFMLSDHKAGQRIVLAANPRYYGGRPHLDAVAFLIAPDPAVAEKALSDGSLLAAEVPQDTWRDFAAQAVAQTGFTLGTAPGSAYYFLAFNLRQGHLFADTALRQAVADALDKTRLVRDATDGAGLPIWSDVSPASWAYDTQVSHLDNDPAKAKALLDQAGWAPGADGIRQKNGQKLAFALYVPANDPVRRVAAGRIQGSLATVGISTTVAPADFASVLQARLDPRRTPAFDFDAMLLGWAGGSPDPDDFALFHSTQIPTTDNPTGLNFTGFAAAEFDQVSMQARGDYDFATRAALQGRLQEILAQQVPYLFLWADQRFLITSRRIGGPVDPGSPRWLWNVEQWWLGPAP